MNSDLILLKIEHDTDPESRGYAAMTPESVASDLNDQRYVTLYLMEL